MIGSHGTVRNRRSPVRRTPRSALALVALTLGGLLTSPARAMTIDVTYGSGVTSDMQAAFTEVVNAYDAAFANNITLQIGLEGENAGNAFLGESSAATAPISYATWYSAMTAYDASGLSNPTFDTAYNTLPNASALGTSGAVTVRAADLTALGFSVDLGGAPDISTGTGLDGIITINTGLSLAIPFRSSMPSGSYDLISVLEHELDEVLGIGSGLTDGTYPTTPEAEDYFRYSAVGTLSFTPSGSAYFSIDGGVTDLANFNQSGVGDYNDWATGSCPSSDPLPQNASACPNQITTLLQNGTTPDPELIALDALGYDLANTAPLLALDNSQEAIPEPATIVLLTPGLALLMLRRRITTPTHTRRHRTNPRRLPATHLYTLVDWSKLMSCVMIAPRGRRLSFCRHSESMAGGMARGRNRPIGDADGSLARSSGPAEA